VEGRKVGVVDSEVNGFTCEACFSTLTNVDFDPDRFVELINKSVRMRDSLAAKVKAAGGKTDFGDGPAVFKPADTQEAMIAQGEKVGIKSDPSIDPDIHSLQQTIIYGLKVFVLMQIMPGFSGKRMTRYTRLFMKLWQPLG
jgi:hydroxylamine reductase